MVDTIKSLSITNLDATPVVVNATGVGAGGYLKNVSDYVTPTTGGLGSTSSTYRILRLPTNAKLKALTLTADEELDTSTGLKFDVGAYYSDSTVDGTPAADQGTAIGVALFASQLVFQSAFQKVNALTAYAVAAQNEPLWKGLGLSADPGGFIDVVVGVHTAATSAQSTNLQAQAEYVE